MESIINLIIIVLEENEQTGKLYYMQISDIEKTLFIRLLLECEG